MLRRVALRRCAEQLDEQAWVPQHRSPVPRRAAHGTGRTTDRIETTNTLSKDQFQWFVAGSALNQIRAEAAAGA